MAKNGEHAYEYAPLSDSVVEPLKLLKDKLGLSRPAAVAAAFLPPASAAKPGRGLSDTLIRTTWAVTGWTMGLSGDTGLPNDSSSPVSRPQRVQTKCKHAPHHSTTHGTLD
jgi:hypothetical protein